MQALPIIEVLELHVLHIAISVSSKAPPISCLSPLVRQHLTSQCTASTGGNVTEDILKNCSEFDALRRAREPFPFLASLDRVNQDLGCLRPSMRDRHI